MNNKGFVPILIIVVGAMLFAGWFWAGHDEREDRKEQITSSDLALPRITASIELKELRAVAYLYPKHEIYLTDRGNPDGKSWALLPIKFKGLKIFIRPELREDA